MDLNENERKKRSPFGGKPQKTIRFGISADARLIEKFDGLVTERNYVNRSEAIRDLIRNQLVESSWAKNNENVVGTITLVCNLESKELSERLKEIQRENCSNIISTILVPMDDHNCLQVLIVRGESQRVKSMSDKLIAMKGIKHGRLTMSATGAELY